MNLGDIVGELMRQGMAPQTKQRIEHATGVNGLGSATGSPDLGALLGSMLGGGSGGQSSAGGQSGGGLGDVLGGLLGGAGDGQSTGGGQSASGLGDVLGGLLRGSSGKGGGQASSTQSSGGTGDILGGLGQMLGSDSGVGGMSKGQLGGLGALAGAILGGGGGATKGAVGGSAMALLGTLALSALKNWQAQSADTDQASGNALGLTETEVRQIAAPETAELCLRGMIEAIKSDGKVSQDEIERLTGKLAEGGISDEEKHFVQGEMAKPQDLAGLTKAIPNPEVGIQVYAAALMAISVDTPAEKAFLKGLASGAGIDSGAVARLHQMVGAPTA